MIKFRVLLLSALVGALIFSVPMGSGAQSAGAIRKKLESSMLLPGTITVSSEGKVLAYTLEPKVPLNDALTQFLGNAITAWRFQITGLDSELATTTVPMYLRLQANPAADGKVNIMIATRSFGASTSATPSDYPTPAKMAPPSFPAAAAKMRVTGTVYLVMQIGHDGKVMNADAQQVNLRVAGGEAQMTSMRRMFTDVAVKAARNWTFITPSTGKQMSDESWFVRVPVDFMYPGERRAQTGEWDTYIPGPLNTKIHWAQEKLHIAGSPDALPAGGVYPMQEPELKLLESPAG